MMVEHQEMEVAVGLQLDELSQLQLLMQQLILDQVQVAMVVVQALVQLLVMVVLVLLLFVTHFKEKSCHITQK
jgi:hypothetical protein